jgi:hypothetical protein
MQNETIKVRATESGQEIDVLVYRKSPQQIEVMLGEGLHSSRCVLMPTANQRAYAGNIMGREIVYERSVDQVTEDIDRLKPSTRRR